MRHISSYFIDIKHPRTGHWGECLKKTAWKGVSWLVNYTIQYWEEQRRDEMSTACSMDGKDKTCSALWSEDMTVGRQRGRISHNWKHNIKMDLTKLGWKSVEWIHVAEDTEPEAGLCKHGKKKPRWVQSGHFGEGKNLLLLPRFKIRIVQLTAQSPHQLHYHGLTIK